MIAQSIDGPTQSGREQPGHDPARERTAGSSSGRDSPRQPRAGREAEGWELLKFHDALRSAEPEHQSLDHCSKVRTQTNSMRFGSNRNHRIFAFAKSYDQWIPCLPPIRRPLVAPPTSYGCWRFALCYTEVIACPDPSDQGLCTPSPSVRQVPPRKRGSINTSRQPLAFEGQSSQNTQSIDARSGRL